MHDVSKQGAFLIGQWNLLNEVQWISPDTIEASGYVPKDCIWFAGHFPGEPILPGIALISAIYEAIEKSGRHRGGTVGLSTLKRIRFTGPVRPGDRLHLNLTREDIKGAVSYHFKVTVEESTVCSGIVAALKNAEEKKEEL